MGTYLSQPDTTKYSDSGRYDLKRESDGKDLPFAVSEMQGWRKTMEDAHIALGNLEKNYDVPTGTSIFAVFDGHAGREVAAFCEKHFVEQLVELESFKAGAYREALVECFHRMDEMLRDPRYRNEINSLKQGAMRNINSLHTMSSNDNLRENVKKPKDFEAETEAETEVDPVETGSEESEIDLNLDDMEGEESETVKAPRAESMNLNYLKDTLKDFGTPNGPKPDDLNLNLTPKVKQTANVEEKSQKGKSDGDSEELNVHERMKQAETKGSISRTEAFELMMQVLKLQRNGSKPKNSSPGENKDDSSNSNVAESDKIEFDDDAPVNSLLDFPTMAGCTAIVALIVNQQLFVASAGDSRAVLCRNSKAIGLSQDHKPLNEKEKTRIENANGFVSEVGRVCGNLNLSRSIGDLKYKTNETLHRAQQIITAEPDVSLNQISNDDLFFVIACDGVWDILTNEAIVEFIKAELLVQAKRKEVDVIKIVEKIFERCISEDPLRTQGLGGDNMTCILIFLKPIEEVLHILTQKKA